MSRLVAQLRDYINWSFAITVAFTVGLFAADPLKKQFQVDVILGALSTLLLIATVIRYFVYLHAVRTELDLLDRVLEAGEVFAVRGRVLPTTLVLAALFGILIARSTDILIYSLASIGLSLADLYGQATVNRNVAIRLVRGDVRAEANDVGLINPLQSYYIERHLLLHAASFAVASCFALVFAIISKLTLKSLWQYCAVGIMILTIVVGEGIIAHWRKIRDQEMTRERS